MSQSNGHLDFDTAVLPHLDAAFNLAWWLTHNRQDAEDVVQEALLRAFRYFSAFRGGNTRAWLLKIVRNTCYTWRHRDWLRQSTVEFDERLFPSPAMAANPEETLLRGDTTTMVRVAVQALSPVLREVLILRELEGLSYKEIAEVTEIPFGTVMSRLSRARGALRNALAGFAMENYLPAPAGHGGQTRAFGAQTAS